MTTKTPHRTEPRYTLTNLVRLYGPATVQAELDALMADMRACDGDGVMPVTTAQAVGPDLRLSVRAALRGWR